MAENTEISWCDHTANLWWGCTEVHEGCDHCYARELAHRWGFEVWGAKGVRRVINGVWKDLARYQRKADEAGVIRSVFVGSMMDIFEKPMPVVDDKGNELVGVDSIHGHIGDAEKNNANLTTGHLRVQLFKNISEGLYPNLLFLLLTKRPSNINKYIPEEWKVIGAPSNVMFGTTVVNQETADKLIPQLLEVNGRRFLSMEPLLGPVDITQRQINYSVPTRYTESNGKQYGIEWTDPGDAFVGIDWVIVGGESGNKARPMHPDWARSLRDQCAAAGVSFHFKQWGEWAPTNLRRLEEERAWNTYINLDGSSGECCFGGDMERVANYTGDIKFRCAIILKKGKKAAGRLLDGKEYNEFPTLPEKPPDHGVL